MAKKTTKKDVKKKAPKRVTKQEGRYAGFWLRVLAWIVDSFVLLGVSFVVGIILGIVTLGSGSSENIVYDLMGIVIAWLYYALFESSLYQATPGKLALNLQVVSVDNKRLSFGRATGRFFAKMLSGLIFLIGFIMIAFTKKKQGLHDIIAGSLVVQKK